VLALVRQVLAAQSAIRALSVPHAVILPARILSCRSPDRLETGVPLFEGAVARFPFRLLFGGFLNFPKDICPTSLEIAAEGRIRRPTIIDNHSREILPKDFRGNIASSTLSDCVQRVFLGGERPGPVCSPTRLIPVSST